MSDKKDIRVIFEPGCFDSFDGSQEELDELMNEIHRMVETGELFEKARPLDFDDLDDLPEDVLETLLNFDPDGENSTKNTRH